MSTIAEAEQNYISQLSTLYDQAESKSIAWWCINHVCKISKAIFLASKNEVLSAEKEGALNLLLKELITGKPVQYVLGETEFYGLTFKVNPFVLIPRPETEELVDWVLIELRNRMNAAVSLKAEGKAFVSEVIDLDNNEITLEALIYENELVRILDLGTGSGCIPISIKKYLPQVELTGIDISVGALQTARENANFNQVSVEFIEDSILNMCNDAILNTQYAVIVSNPPYVTESEKSGMFKNVLEYEPHQALFVPDTTALIFYNSIADFAVNHLVKSGLLFLEINENLGSEMVSLLETKGFSDIELRQDMRGKNRMIRATI
jgi:release factor glutamine methyltransferase